jgi:DNA repair exonuclease SbcCD ATPase subunit
MFRFLELELHYWDLWQAVRVPLDAAVVLVTGPNGSGKTTLIDAVRQLLNAPRLSSRRRLQHYLRQPDAPALIRAVVSNVDPTGAPPFRRERLTTPEVTLACALVPSGGGTPEKRFAVLPGRPSLDELRARLLESRDFYPPERYGRVLEHAGVSRSLMSVLAIEQGKTNSLFDLKPRELFQRVLEMLGDQAILERYREARRRYEDTDRELMHQVIALGAAQAELTRVRREVQRLIEWEEARDKVAELEARLPAAELQRLLVLRREATSKSRELQTKVRLGEVELTEARVRSGKGVAEAAEAEGELGRARTEEDDAQAAWGDATRAEAETATILVQLERKQREFEPILPADLAVLEREHEAALRERIGAEDGERAASDHAVEAAQKVKRLLAGLPDYPDAVVRTLDTLAAHGIQATILAATVEMTDTGLAESIEAALGDARYALLVSPADHERTVKLARAHNFPGPVYAGPRTEAPERAGPLDLAPGAPAWLPSWLAPIDLTADGSWRDARGTWVAKTQERVLGEAGRAAAVAQAKQNLEDAERRLDIARESLDAARARYDEIAAALERERRRQRLLVDLRELPDAKVRAAETATALRGATERLRDARAAHDVTRARSAAATRARDEADAKVKTILDRLAGERDALDEVVRQLRATEEQISALTDQVAPDLRERAEQGELDGPDTVGADLRRAQETFTTLPEPPPPTIREEERHLRANVEDLERHVKDRRREADEARAELAQCRARYLEVVNSTLVDYRQRSAGIAAAAAVAVEMELPRLADDDRTLDEAGIHVRFGFDGKDPLLLGDASFSGGQQVIAGLILLMAMAETDGQGFFMLDEPFAHLSIDRIDDVGRFLRATRSQFILTAPTTLDRAQLDPASLLIVLQKKRPDEAFAPVPIVAVA